MGSIYSNKNTIRVHKMLHVDIIWAKNNTKRKTTQNLIVNITFKYKDWINVIINRINIIRVSTTTHKHQQNIKKETYAKLLRERIWKTTVIDAQNRGTYLISILVFPSPTGYIVKSFDFTLLIWGIFHRPLKWWVIFQNSWTSWTG